MPRFGKDKDARNEELDRQAAEEVERLTRRGMGGGGMGGPGMPGMGGGAPRLTPPSPLEMMAAEVADRPRPVKQGAAPRRPSARPQQGMTPMPSGGVGSSFGPGGLNPGPRGGFSAPPPPAFGGGAYEEDYGGHVTGPSVYNAEPDEDEEMSITEMALMDHAARTGHNPEDLVMMYDASSAEEMRDRAMRQFYERQASRAPGSGTNDPFAPAGTRRGPAGPASAPRRDDPAAAGGALAQRLAARRRQEEQSRPAAPQAQPAPAARSTRPTVPAAAPAASAARPKPSEREVDEGALARVLARRRAALGVDSPSPAAEPAEAETGPRHAAARGPLRSVPTEAEAAAVADEPAPAAKKAPAKRAAKKAAPAEAEAAAPIAMPAAGGDAPPAKKAAAKRPAKKAAAAPAAKKAPAKKAPAAKKGGATLASPAPAKKKAPAKKAPAGKAKTIFCIECGEKNPVIAKFCFNCGTRLAAPEA